MFADTTVDQSRLESTGHEVSRAVDRAHRRRPLAHNEPSERMLIREVLYALQGIDGVLLQRDPVKDTIVLTKDTRMSCSMEQQTLRLVECGWLFSKVRRFVDARIGDRSIGLVTQGLCAALHAEMNEFYRLIAVMEAQLQQEEDPGVDVGSESLTLLRLSVWLFEPRFRLKMLARIVDSVAGHRGGSLASLLYKYLHHADPDVGSLVRRILTQATQPLYVLICRWMFDGHLDDPYQEFFIAVDPSVSDQRLWHDKYSLRTAMLPSFLPRAQAMKILVTGKSIQFLRRLCQDRTRISDLEHVKQSISNQVSCTFSQESSTVFKDMVSTVYKSTSSYLLKVLCDEYQLQQHMKAMRRYLLLGQGDFLQHLMDLLHDQLSQAASCLYQHDLMGTLESAVRATNAQYEDPEMLKRLDVRLLQVSPGDTGWDVFCLDYHVDGPISTVFTADCIVLYLRTFNFLWRSKRMEYILSSVWKQQMSDARLLYRQLPELIPVLHHCHMIASQMFHFVQQIQYYINFEVLECAWQELINDMKKSEDLDHVLAAHQSFLDKVISRALLSESATRVLSQLRAVFDLVVQFEQKQNTLHEAALEEIALRHHYRKRLDSHEQQGSWGVTEEEEAEEMSRRDEFVRSIPAFGMQFKILSQAYQTLVVSFVQLVAAHEDTSLRGLSFRLDFNEFYRCSQPVCPGDGGKQR